MPAPRRALKAAVMAELLIEHIRHALDGHTVKE
jgi:hypothetical protein